MLKGRPLAESTQAGVASLVDGCSGDWSGAVALARKEQATGGPIVVPQGKFFALGDNRDNSEDSRFWGFLDGSAIKGRPMFVYYSYQKDLSPFAWLSSVRWSRIGELVH